MIFNRISLKALLIAAVFAISSQVRADQNEPELNVLFELLKENISEYEAADVTRQIWQHWLATDNKELEMLMQGGMDDMSSADLKLAVEKFSEAIDMAPAFAEAWNKRATVYFMMGEFELSTADVAATLSLEPRHFGALSGQGMIYMQLENHDAALDYFKRALEVNPFMDQVRRTIEYLESEKSKDLI